MPATKEDDGAMPDLTTQNADADDLVVEVTFPGLDVPGLLHLPSMRVIPPLAGADDDPDPDDEDPDDDPDEDPDDEEVDEDELSDAVKEILRKNRDAVKKANARARAAEAKVRTAAKPKPKPKAPPKPAAKADPKPDDEPAATADTLTPKLQRANLKAALAELEEPITGARAKAVMRLLDDVEYDDDDEPLDLDGALERAEETYGKEIVRGAKPSDDEDDDESTTRRKKPNVNGREGGGGAKPPALTAAEVAAARAAGMKPEKWKALQGGASLADWQALQSKKKDT